MFTSIRHSLWFSTGKNLPQMHELKGHVSIIANWKTLSVVGNFHVHSSFVLTDVEQDLRSAGKFPNPAIQLRKMWESCSSIYGTSQTCAEHPLQSWTTRIAAGLLTER